MAMANKNCIGVFVTQLWPVQALACGGGDGGGGTKNIISPKIFKFRGYNYDVIKMKLINFGSYFIRYAGSLLHNFARISMFCMFWNQ